MNYLLTLPNFLLYYGCSLLVFLVFIGLYTALTPYREAVEILEKRNPAAALTLAGAMIGFSLPLASLIFHAANIVDLLLWSGIAIVIQIATFFGISLVFRQIRRRIEEGDISAGIILASLSLVAGILNAACMSY